MLRAIYSRWVMYVGAENPDLRCPAAKEKAGIEVSS
jgi:hypothetical protein